MRPIADRFFGIPSDLATEENTHYQEYRRNVRFLGGGLSLLLGGTVAYTTGVDVGEVAGVDVAKSASGIFTLAGAVTAYIKLIYVIEGLDRLSRD